MTKRTWPAALTLAVLSPAIAELLSGSTPPARFANPLVFLYFLSFYGCGAVLARELVRRRGLGWANLVLLGAAYGVLEEGLVVGSWFNLHWPDEASMGTYARLLDTNWLWALHLTTYHAVFSITVPVLLAETLWPDVADRPWLLRRGLRAVIACLAVVSVLSCIGFSFLMFRGRGYDHPPATWLLAAALAAGLLVAGLRAGRRPAGSDRPPPSPWALRLAALGVTVAVFFVGWGGPHVFGIGAVAVALLAGIVAAAARGVRRWSGRRGWDGRHRLALAEGCLAFLVLLAPLMELVVRPAGKPEAGLTVVALAAAAGLVWLDRRSGRPPAAVQPPAPAV